MASENLATWPYRCSMPAWRYWYFLLQFFATFFRCFARRKPESLKGRVIRRQTIREAGGRRVSAVCRKWPAADRKEVIRLQPRVNVCTMTYLSSLFKQPSSLFGWRRRVQGSVERVCLELEKIKRQGSGQNDVKQLL